MPSHGGVLYVTQQDGFRHRSRRNATLAAAGLLLLLLGGWAGYGIASTLNPTTAQKITTDETFSGVVTLVNADGSAGCIKPTGDRSKVCGSFFTEGGTRLQVGEQVEVAHQRAQIGRSGGNADLLLIYGTG